MCCQPPSGGGPGNALHTMHVVLMMVYQQFVAYCVFCVVHAYLVCAVYAC